MFQKMIVFNKTAEMIRGTIAPKDRLLTDEETLVYNKLAIEIVTYVVNEVQKAYEEAKND